MLRGINIVKDMLHGIAVHVDMKRLLWLTCWGDWMYPWQQCNLYLA